MNSLVCVEPGRFEFRQKTVPTVTKGHAVVKVRRIGICGTDFHAFAGNQPFFTYPRILGHELSGELVDADGADDFRSGERVTVIPYFYCGRCVACRAGKTNCCSSIAVCGVHTDGGMVEYLSVPSYSLLHGGDLDLDALALVEPMAIGAHGVARAGVLPGEFVLVTGAGPIGLCVMEFARLRGGRVIALDVNEYRLRFCREKLGVEYAIDGRVDDVMESLRAITGGDMPTVVIDATGNQKAIIDAFRYMAFGGRYVLVGLQRNDITFSHPEFHKREATLMSSRNAVRDDFTVVLDAFARKAVDPQVFITHRGEFATLDTDFSKWADPASNVIKAMVNVA